MSLYSCHEIPGAGYAMHKFDSDFNPEAVYEVTNATCTCPAGARPTCKHRSRLLPAFMKREHIGDGWFLNDANMMWHRPVRVDLPPNVDPQEFEPQVAAYINPTPQGVSGEGPGQSPLIGGTEFCGHGVMRSICPECNQPTSPSVTGRSQPDGFKRRV